ncbi:hypothetical protein [Glutamicibacter sp.]|uniref:hypothetical protein n=1 Tax=Glutamicibacter sp. TaxID=1931995 RepID=UPI0028BD3F95|nr:hypothetical protein [Glutamicibacter sp.]
MSQYETTPRPATPGHIAQRVEHIDPEQLEASLSSLADHDVTDHAQIYEQLLSGLQQELNSSEHGGA